MTYLSTRRVEGENMRRLMVLVLTLAALVALSLPAMAETQPTGVANALGRNGGNSAPGPHCHINLVASEHSAAST